MARPPKRFERRLGLLRTVPGSVRVAVIPSPHEVQVDLDTKKDRAWFENRIRFFRSQLRAYRNLKGWRITVKMKRSRQVGHFHVTVFSSQRLTMLERICMAALLGDDPSRAMYNFFRYLNESRFPVLFYERKRK
jgi:hypothetical protein